VAKLATAITSKVAQFYILRVCFSGFTAAAQMYMVSNMRGLFSAREISYTKVGLLFSTAMALSSHTFLPSQFSMNCLTLAVAFWFRWRSCGRGLLGATVSLAFAVVVGWPFAVLVGIFWVIPYITLWPKALLSVRFYVYAFIAALVTVAPSIALDTLLYGRPVFASLNVVLYNTSIGASMVG
jgi:alpha-1,2-mannosyltransferase